MPLYRRCCFILLDGARPDVLGQLLQRGEMPFFQQLFVEQGTFTKGVTAFPSTTGAAYLPYLTGFYPGHCNVPGIRWFDRSRQVHRSYVGIEHLFFNKDLSPAVKTLFEYTKRSVTLFNIVHRGAKTPKYFQKSWRTLVAKMTGQWGKMDAWLSTIAREVIKKEFDMLFIALPGIDETSHDAHPFSEKVLVLYRQFDIELGKLICDLERHGRREETLFVLASDHGLSPVHTHFDLVQFLEAHKLRVLHYPKIYRRYFDAVVMPSGNAMAHLYFQNEAHSYRESWMDRLTQESAIAWVAAKEEGGVRVKSKNGEALISENGEKISYRVVGKDPLGFSHIPVHFSDLQGLGLSFSQTHPDAFRQLLQIFHSHRCGDIIVNATLGYDLRKSFEWPEHFSSHGSLHREHMHIPIAFSHPLKLLHPIRSVDVFPTILKLLGLSESPICDGKVLNF